MTDRNLTEIAVILDRSGSMQSIRTDMVGGFARFIHEQQALPGRCVVSLYQFDNVYETCFEERNIHSVGDLVLEPRGGTALFDAVGRSISRIGNRLREKPAHARPGGVIVLIITDGEENASHEYTLARVRQMIELQEKDYSWKFLYLSADPGAFTHAQGLGIGWQQTAYYAPSAAGSNAMYGGISASVATYRSLVQTGMGEYFTGGLGKSFGTEAGGSATIGPDPARES